MEAARSLDGNGSRNAQSHLVSDEQFELILQREVELTVRQIKATGGRVLD